MHLKIAPLPSELTAERGSFASGLRELALSDPHYLGGAEQLANVVEAIDHALAREPEHFSLDALMHSSIDVLTAPDTTLSAARPELSRAFDRIFFDRFMPPPQGESRLDTAHRALKLSYSFVEKAYDAVLIGEREHAREFLTEAAHAAVKASGALFEKR